MPTFWAKYNTQTTFVFPMVKRAVVDFAVSADWTPAAADGAISKDAGNLADLTNAVAIVGGTPTRGAALWKVTLTASELSCAVASVQIVDAATKAVEDQSITIYTYGNASAAFAGDWSDIVRLGLTAFPNVASGSAGALLVQGTGTAALSCTSGGVTLADGVSHGGTLGSSTATIACSRFNATSQTANTSAFTAIGNGTGHGLNIGSGSGATGNAINLTANSTNGHGLKSTGAGTGDGAELTAGASGADLDADIAGTLSTVTTLTNLPTMPTDWLTSTGLAASAVTEIWAGVTDSSGVTTLLSRLTAARAGYLDNINNAALATTAAQTGDAYARLGAPAGASIAADIAAVLARCFNATAITNGNLFFSSNGSSYDVDQLQLDLQTVQTTATLTNTTLLAATGTVQDAAATTTSFKTSLTQASNYWNDHLLTFTSGSLDGQTRVISSFNNTNGVITFDEALTSAPANGVSFYILATHVHTRTQIAQSVLDESASGHTTDGTLGAILNDLEDGGRTDLLVDAIKAKTDQFAFGTANRVNAQVYGMETDTLTSGALAASAVSEIQSGLSTHSASDVWAVATRSLTVLDEDSTTLDLDATIRSALGLASANLDTQLDALPTANENADALLDRADAVETGYTVRKALRAIAAKSMGAISMAGTGTEIVKGLGVSTTRGTATVDSSGNISSWSLNL